MEKIDKSKVKTTYEKAQRLRGRLKLAVDTNMSRERSIGKYFSIRTKLKEFFS